MLSIYNTEESLLSLSGERRATVDSIFEYLIQERSHLHPNELTLPFDALETACRERKWKTALNLHFNPTERVNIANFRSFHHVVGKNIDNNEDFSQIVQNM